MRKCLDQFIYDDNYEITYKINGQGQAICINNHEDFLNFISEYKEPNNLTKTMCIYIVLKNLDQFYKRKSE
ncbi:19569_t:CDS:1, partial [Racocetra fulgida]